MRESNNLVLDQVKSESKKNDSNSEFTSQKFLNESNSQKNLKEAKNKVNFEIQKEEKRPMIESKKKVDTNLFANNHPNSNIKYEKNKQTFSSLVNDNEAQFRMIAKKFNEAVEVILELSEKVKKLEESINDLSLKSGTNKKSNSFLSIKNYVFIILVIFITFSVLIFPIDLSFIKLIIKDIVSSI